MKIPIGEFLIEQAYSKRDGDPESPPRLTKVELTDHELVGLLQTVDRGDVNKARRAAEIRIAMTRKHLELPVRVAALLGDVIATAERERRLAWRWFSERVCRTCGACPGFKKFKSGHRKGLNNTKKPLTVYSFCLQPQGGIHAMWVQLGGCQSCWDLLRPALAEELAQLEGVELPDGLRKALKEEKD